MVTMNTSNHAAERQKQRGLRQEILDLILTFGHVDDGSQAAWYTIRTRELSTEAQKLLEKAQRWVVVASPDESTVITTYPNSHPSRHVRRKCKRFLRGRVHRTIADIVTPSGSESAQPLATQEGVGNLGSL